MEFFARIGRVASRVELLFEVIGRVVLGRDLRTTRRLPTDPR